MTSDRFNIKGKIAFVTGGSRGIGLMIARGFVEAGARVYICARDEQRCDAAAATLNQLGECISLPGDLSKSEEVSRISAVFTNKESKLHVLVNNAGTGWVRQRQRQVCSCD